MSRRRRSGRPNGRCPVHGGRHRTGGRHGCRCRGGRHERGSFTAELAAGLPALMLLLFVGLTAVGAVTTKAQCVDAAREAALATARGESGVVAGERTGPPDATVTIFVDGDLVVATVRASVRALGAHLPSTTITATATAVLEPGPLEAGP
ncbi:hypothetical protein Pa4123_36090 [Phytohabitans aurantiacus]|uniref:Mucin-associated surface protein n=1 Tax=Phytohabitans aurantiacus TaxID=3016789 RepID=A0ABQ5QV89_9ACTN|nr:hypothetical protein Pa4123_36090 [Phytohabitans aurantiacus]